MPRNTKLQEAAAAQKKNKFIDLSRLIEAYATDVFLKSAKWGQKNKLDKFAFEVNWDKVTTVHKPPEFQALDSSNSNKDEEDESDPVVEQEYHNNLPTEVEKSFEAERSTKCIATVTIEKGILLDQGTDVTLPRYESNPAVGKFPGTITLGRHNNFTQTLEEPVTWTMKTKIKVGAGKSVVARMKIEEEEVKERFKIITSLSRGPLNIRVVKKSKNETVKTIQGWLPEILRDLDLDGVECLDDRVDFVSEGTTHFKFGIRTIEDNQVI